MKKTVIVVAGGQGVRVGSHWEDLCRESNFNIPHRVAPGGETRFHTVKKALPEVSGGSIVAIHDAVRPLVTRDTIDRCFDTALKNGAAIPCVEVPESLREIRQGKNKPVDRRSFRLVQTPQVFHYDIILEAYRQVYDDVFTDDASVVEKAGYPVSLVKGNHENRKITTPEDFIYAESILSSFKEKSGLF